MKHKMTVRKGQTPGALGRDAFRDRFDANFYDPSFDGERDAIARLEAIAWKNYCDARKSPRQEEAGEGFAEPDYELPVEWKRARERIQLADRTQKDPASASRVLIVCGSPRNNGTCPGEVSKTWRLSNIVREVLDELSIETDLLDLSLLS